jgi:hypothetical protein
MKPAGDSRGNPGERDARVDAAADRLVREVLEEVRAEIKGVLKERLLAAVMDRLDASGSEGSGRHPSAGDIDATVASIAAHAQDVGSIGAGDPDQTEVLYAYGITAGDPVAPDGPGIGGRPVSTVALDGLEALATWIPWAEFGEPGVERHLEDPGWLTQNATAHERVLSRALESGPVLPLRFGTAFRDEDHLRTTLRPHIHLFEAALARVDGRAEWDVKVLCRRDALAGWVEERSERVSELRSTVPQGEGAGFMQRKRIERAVDEEADGLRDELGRVVADSLRIHADDAVPSGSHADPEGDLVLLRSDAYLVAEERRPAFLRAADDAEGCLADRGVEVQVAGPLPPYHFVAVDLREVADA